MATANELFAANGEDYIVIDSDLRTMTFPASVKNIGVENDKDVHKLNFMMPRYFGEYDLSTFGIRINYLNANGDGDMYVVTDPTVEEDAIYFTWLVGRHACLYRGSVTFIICLKLADGEGDVAQEFNTTLASLQVLPGLETEPTILETEHDVIEQLLLSINDTNAKIKAVLDTGLTPEQIAEFYNKSKTYDTQIATINSNAFMPRNIIHNGTSLDTLTTPGTYLCVGMTTGDNAPFINMLLIVTISTDRIYQKAIEYSTSAEAIRHYWGNWKPWTKLPTRAEIDALNRRTVVVDGGNISLDLNTFVNTGLYQFDKLASTMTNAPSNIGTYFSGFLRVTKYNYAKVLQELFGDSVSTLEQKPIFTRMYWNSKWSEWIKQPTRAELDALNSRIAVDVTAGENVAIDTNKSYAVGKMLFLSVKGHTSADVNNAELFTIGGGVTLNPTDYTFFCGVGAAWSLTGIGYCYVNGNKVNGRVTSGQYFHICATIPIN